MPNYTMTKDPFQQIINKSSNNLHSGIAEFFNSKNYKVEVSPYYVDNVTGVSREIDIFAQQEEERVDGAFNNLYIECKYLNSHLVLWQDTYTNNTVLDKYFRDHLEGPLEMIKDRKQISRLGTAMVFTDLHKKLKDGQCVKFYDSTGKNDLLFGAVSQAIKSMLFFSKASNDNDFNYPVVVLGNTKNLLRIKKTSGDIVSAQENFIMPVHYSYLDGKIIKTKNILVYIVLEEFLEQFNQSLTNTRDEFIDLLN